MAAGTVAALVAAIPRARKLALFLNPRFADDAVQDALVACLRHIDRLEADTVHSYLFTCVRRRVFELQGLHKHNEAELHDIHVAPEGDHDAWLDVQAAIATHGRAARRALVGRMIGMHGRELGSASINASAPARRRLREQLA